MIVLTNKELIKVLGGSKINSPFDIIYKFYRIFKIKWLMKKVFID